MRKISILGLSVAVLATTGWLAQASAQSAAPDTSAPASDSTPAPAKAKHTSHRAQGKGIHRGATKGDAAVEDLNAQSLSAAKSGTAFKPATTPTPAKAAKPAKSGKMHHHKKAAKPAADASAPAPDASAPAPDSSK